MESEVGKIPVSPLSSRGYDGSLINCFRAVVCFARKELNYILMRVKKMTIFPPKKKIDMVLQGYEEGIRVI